MPVLPSPEREKEKKREREGERGRDGGRRREEKVEANIIFQSISRQKELFRLWNPQPVPR